MTKAELLDWLHEQHRQWEEFLEQIGPARMDQPGVTAEWSMKDLVAHLTGWNRWLVARLQAAHGGKPVPAPPWPADLQAEDDINAWIYESNSGRSVRAVLDESHQVFQQLIAAIESLPEAVQIDFIEPKFHLGWSGDQRVAVGEFVDPLHEDHEQDIRAWLARQEKN